MRYDLSSIAALLLFIPTVAAAQEETFVPLFNGHDLEGWVNVNCAPETFTVRDEMIISTGKPTGVMRTTKQYENFILELDWMHMQAGGNAGLFVWSDAITARGVPFTRSLEVQILDGHNSENYTSHGDIFSIHGASFLPDRPHPKGWERCLPSEQRCHPAGEWNHYRVVCRDGVIKLAVNGKEVSGGKESMPRKGYICLEAEGSECRFRNIRIAELPGGTATPEQTSEKDHGLRSIYSGLDLRGWKTDSDKWRSKDWILFWEGEKDESVIKSPLTSDASLTEGTFQFDWRWPEPNKVKKLASGDFQLPSFQIGSEVYSIQAQKAKPEEWNRLEITRKNDSIMVRLNGDLITERETIGNGGLISLLPSAEPVEFANLYVQKRGE